MGEVDVERMSEGERLQRTVECTICLSAILHWGIGQARKKFVDVAHALNGSKRLPISSIKVNQ